MTEKKKAVAVLLGITVPVFNNNVALICIHNGKNNSTHFPSMIEQISQSFQCMIAGGGNTSQIFVHEIMTIDIEEQCAVVI